MENQKTQIKALAMSEEQWKQNKLWLLQFPAAFCLPVIEQFERYLFEIPTPTSPPAPLLEERGHGVVREDTNHGIKKRIKKNS